MSDIPHLFVNEREVIDTETWFSHLSKNAGSYENCVVRSLTIVKDLNSWVDHEYLQIVIERTDTQFRTRIIAERHLEQDQVVIGLWRPRRPSSSSSSSSLSSADSPMSSVYEGELPLPLLTLTLESDKLKVIDLAQILKLTTTAGGKYSLFKNRHCYWFAMAVYSIIKSGFTCKEKSWPFARWRGQKILFKGAGKKDAHEFEHIRTNGILYCSGSLPMADGKLFQVISKDVTHLERFSNESSRNIVDNEKLTELVLNDSTSKITMSELEKSNLESIPGSLDPDSIDDSAIRDSDSAEYTDVYSKFEQNKPVAIVTSLENSEELLSPENYISLSPSKAEQEAIESTIKVMVADVLEAYKNHQ